MGISERPAAEGPEPLRKGSTSALSNESPQRVFSVVWIHSLLVRDVIPLPGAPSQGICEPVGQEYTYSPECSSRYIDWST